MQKKFKNINLPESYLNALAEQFIISFEKVTLFDILILKKKNKNKHQLTRNQANPSSQQFSKFYRKLKPHQPKQADVY